MYRNLRRRMHTNSNSDTVYGDTKSNTLRNKHAPEQKHADSYPTGGGEKKLHTLKRDGKSNSPLIIYRSKTQSAKYVHSTQNKTHQRPILTINRELLNKHS